MKIFFFFKQITKSFKKSWKNMKKIKITLKKVKQILRKKHWKWWSCRICNSDCTVKSFSFGATCNTWGPKNGRNDPIRATAGKKTSRRLQRQRNFGRSTPWNRPDCKTARYGQFFAENQFSPADEFVLVGLVVRKCHFDVTACAEARRLAQK